MVIRVLRLLRVIRVLKLVGFIQEASVLKNALWGARNKILLFLGSGPRIGDTFRNHGLPRRAW